MAREFHETVEEVARETELDEIRAQTNQVLAGQLPELSDDDRNTSNLEANYELKKGSSEVAGCKNVSRLEQAETRPEITGENFDPDKKN